MQVNMLHNKSVTVTYQEAINNENKVGTVRAFSNEKEIKINMQTISKQRKKHSSNSKSKAMISKCISKQYES